MRLFESHSKAPILFTSVQPFYLLLAWLRPANPRQLPGDLLLRFVITAPLQQREDATSYLIVLLALREVIQMPISSVSLSSSGLVLQLRAPLSAARELQFCFGSQLPEFFLVQRFSQGYVSFGSSLKPVAE